jgi:hypothetical protein
MRSVLKFNPTFFSEKGNKTTPTLCQIDAYGFKQGRHNHQVTAERLNLTGHCQKTIEMAILRK